MLCLCVKLDGGVGGCTGGSRGEGGGQSQTFAGQNMVRHLHLNTQAPFSSPVFKGRAKPQGVTWAPLPPPPPLDSPVGGLDV